MTLHDHLGAHPAALAQLVEAQERWTPPELARELVLHRYAVDQETLDAFITAVCEDLETADPERYVEISDEQALHDRIALARLRSALPALALVTGPMLEAECVRLDEEEAERQRRRPRVKGRWRPLRARGTT